MWHVGRPQWRLFCLALGCALTATQAMAQSPVLTTVSETVFRADGSPASGTLLPSWPAFTTADGHTMAAGNKSVALGSNGSLTVQLAPNAGATPSGITYLVTYQLSDAP
jgi:trimeric autotransporter adhesin